MLSAGMTDCLHYHALCSLRTDAEKSLKRKKSMIFSLSLSFVLFRTFRPSHLPFDLCKHAKFHWLHLRVFQLRWSCCFTCGTMHKVPFPPQSQHSSHFQSFTWSPSLSLTRSCFTLYRPFTPSLSSCLHSAAFACILIFVWISICVHFDLLLPVFMLHSGKSGNFVVVVVVVVGDSNSTSNRTTTTPAMMMTTTTHTHTERLGISEEKVLFTLAPLLPKTSKQAASPCQCRQFYRTHIKC